MGLRIAKLVTLLSERESANLKDIFCHIPNTYFNTYKFILKKSALKAFYLSWSHIHIVEKAGNLSNIKSDHSISFHIIVLSLTKWGAAAQNKDFVEKIA